MRRSLLIICLVALAHAGFYIMFERPDWDAVWSDQRGYERLGAALATTGQFTRYADADTFVPEVIRTPGYPAFVAVVYLLFGVGNHMAVAVAQAFMFAGLCLLTYFIAKRAVGERTAIVAGAATALFSPFPYFGALVVTELWTAFVATAAMLICVRAVQGRKLVDFAVAGLLFSCTTLVRPAFILLPFFLAITMPLFVKRERSPRALGGWAALALTAALTMVPWFAYNYVNLGQFTLSPAGGVGRGLWEGSWQGVWPGKLQAELTNLADGVADRAELNQRVRDKAAETGAPAEPMLQYVNEWRDVRAMWDTPTDPAERARARVAADQEYLRYAVLHMKADPIGHVGRRLTRGLFQLWAAEVPIRYTLINSTPTIVIRAIWVVQLLLLLMAAYGAIWLARHQRWSEAVLLTMPLIYVTGVHLPLLCEARQSLPMWPLVLVLAATTITSRQTADS